MDTTRDTLTLEVQRLIACFLALLTQPQAKISALAKAVRAAEERVRRWVIQLALMRHDPYTDDLATAPLAETTDEETAAREKPQRTKTPRAPRKPDSDADPAHLAKLAHWLSRLRTLAAILKDPDRAVAFVRPHLRAAAYDFVLPYNPAIEAKLAATIAATRAKAGAPPEDTSHTLRGLLAPLKPPPDSS